MASERASIDIQQIPALVALVEEVRATRQPLRITRANEDVAILMPVAEPRRKRRPRARPSGTPITDRTAGIFKDYRLERPLTPREEREAFEQGVADEVSGKLGG